MIDKSKVQRQSEEIDRRIAKLNREIQSVYLDGIRDAQNVNRPDWITREARRKARIKSLRNQINRLESQRPRSEERRSDLAREASIHVRARRNPKLAGLAFSLAIAAVSALDRKPREHFFSAEHASRVDIIRAEWALIQAAKG